jgi:hypothetical protein
VDGHATFLDGEEGLAASATIDISYFLTTFDNRTTSAL